MGKKILQAISGILLAGLTAIAMGTWGLPEENDLLYEISGFRISVSGIGAGISLLTVLAFADGWAALRKKQGEQQGSTDGVWNGLGFGLLPGIAVWKCFEQATAMRIGAAVPEGMQVIAMFSSEGRYLPARMEICLALILFLLTVIWLMVRKQPFPGNGDLAGVALTLWGGGRLITDACHGEACLFGLGGVTGWIAAGLMAAVLIHWTGRTIRQRKNIGYAWACAPVFVLSIAAVTLIRNGIPELGNPPAEAVLTVCFTLLAVKSVLCMGRVSRG